jgi:DNA helicase-2/ATP-dependent DNA helicase PcrA
MENAILQGLNPPQAEAVQHTEGPLLILAGAGTGKTRVLTSRIAYILGEGLAFPNEIMAVTFTNKAAKEMNERVEKLIGASTAGMWMGTFHSISARLLRRHAELAGLNPDFVIIDMDDQKRLLKQIITEKGIDDKQWPPRLLGAIISKWKDNGWRPEDVPNDEKNAFNRRGVELYREYQQRLEAMNAADFGDLLLKSLLLLKNNPTVLEQYQNRFRYVLVDEYQDTNSVQYQWLRLLVMAHKNICVVGDDDQSIYAWRGAKVENILKFDKDFDNTKVVRLEQNYRSSGHILKTAAGLISKNDSRHDKTLWTEDDDGELVEVHPVYDGKEEARMVADRIDNRGNYSDCAVLVRTAAQTRPIEEAFVKKHIAYVVVGGLRFYERKEIRDAIAYLRLIQSSQDSLAFERIINVPKRGIGKATVDEIAMLAREQEIPMYEATLDLINSGLVSPRLLTKLREFTGNIEKWRAKEKETTLDRLMEDVLEESGYLDMLRNDKNKDEAKTRMDTLKELVRALQEYSDLTSFLEHVSLVMDGDSRTDEDTVKLSTVHAAKGLEFDTVFIPGFEEGIFPHQRSLDESGVKGVEEERRLAYVAITRAQRKLILSYASSRQMYGRWEPSTASRFLGEMPQEHLDYAQSTAPSWRPMAGSAMDRSHKGDWGKRREPLFSTNTQPTGKKVGDYVIGSRVFHQKFGYGAIRKSEGRGETQRLTIQFEKAGQKKLVASLANLEVV